MKKGKVFFHPIEGSGQLSISWGAQPKGDAIEAKKGAGVGFFSDQGDLLSVIFDEVSDSEDHQILEFAKYRIEVSIKNGKVTFKLTRPKPKRKVKCSSPKSSSRKTKVLKKKK